ncbi:phosphatase PAP2 family protein [Brumimicrobium oceani]|uniref:Phosphatase PAP2 family protein n=1 Tax=Brumimicrobium oceani TaxID=2100725 RepID=A0A2U2XDM6_9FLAO|nr:phosphatase PAP2 family protein [Brumimicrobium oceani]PWH85909.1 phosphatase PAP2 family protein [Brumimicrobium oceani]
MIEWLKEIEQTVLIAINSAHSPFLDWLMWWISNTPIWFPFYIFLFVLVYYKYSLKHAVWFTVFGFAAVGFADFTANYGFKHTFMRYRPSHHLTLGEQLRYYEFKPGELYKGGQYGFISGHATNSFVIAVMFIQQLKSKIKFIVPILLFWALLVSYSRMYLGVHYPSDIIGGALWGSGVAFLFHFIYRKTVLKT